MWSDFVYSIKWLGIRVLLFNVIIAGSGIALVAYGLVEAHLPVEWHPFAEGIANFVGPMVTFLGVGVTAASVYFPVAMPTKPDPASKMLTAPIALIGCVVGIVGVIVYGRVSGHIVNGFALLGLAGALLRIQPTPQRSPDTF